MFCVLPSMVNCGDLFLIYGDNEYFELYDEFSFDEAHKQCLSMNSSMVQPEYQQELNFIGHQFLLDNDDHLWIEAPPFGLHENNAEFTWSCFDSCCSLRHTSNDQSKPDCHARQSVICRRPRDVVYERAIKANQYDKLIFVTDNVTSADNCSVTCRQMSSELASFDSLNEHDYWKKYLPKTSSLWTSARRTNPMTDSFEWQDKDGPRPMTYQPWASSLTTNCQISMTCCARLNVLHGMNISKTRCDDQYRCLCERPLSASHHDRYTSWAASLFNRKQIRLIQRQLAGGATSGVSGKQMGHGGVISELKLRLDSLETSNKVMSTFISLIAIGLVGFCALTMYRRWHVMNKFNRQRIEYVGNRDAIGGTLE